MAKIENITVMTQTRYVFVIFPFATYKQVGEIGLLTVFGVPIYKRVDHMRSLFGVVFSTACRCDNCKIDGGYAPCLKNPKSFAAPPRNP